MKPITQKTPLGHVVFCDDIRQEASGKATYVGVYGQTMLLHRRPPFVLPSFAFAATYMERPGESADPVYLRVYFPGESDDEPSYEMKLPMEEARASKPPEGSDDPVLVVSVKAVRPTPIINQTGLIRVRAVRGDEYLSLGHLRVELSAKAKALEVDSEEDDTAEENAPAT